MKKPNDYEAVQGYGEFTPLKLGGHICKIMKVEEMVSRSGKDMLKISLDVAEGPQAGYYTKQFKDDTRDTKKWGCVFYQLLLDNDGKTNKGLKTFNTSIEESNSGFKIAWGDSYCATLKGKLVGGVFGREEYLNNDGEAKFSTKCMFFRSVETIRAGMEIPADKLLNGSTKPAAAQGMNAEGFYPIDEEVDDESLPF